MNFIVFNHNTENKMFNFKLNNVEVGDNEIKFAFYSSKKYTFIKGLRFGFEFYEGNKLIKKEDYPLKSVTLEYTDNTPIVNSHILIKPDTQYKILGWIEHPGEKRLIQTCILDKMFPPKPFPSWRWNGEDWEAPIPKKFDAPYQWNETNQKWEIDPMTPFVQHPGYEVE